MKKYIFSLLLVASALASYAQTQKKYQGLLWEITGNGLSKPSYLYGTMHVSEKLAFHLSDTFFLALKKSELVALELDPGTWMDETLEMDRAEEQKEFSNAARQANGFYSYAFKPFFPEKNDLARMIRVKPRLINSMLYRSNEAYDEFEEDTYLDLFIYQAGRKLNKKVVGLEDFMISRKMVDKAYNGEDEMDEEKLREERELLRIRIRQMEKVKSMREYQEDSYRNGDLDMIDSIYRLMNPGTVFMKNMLWDRNVIMANGMDSLMKHHTIFTGVGAAHLPGDKGVIELLRAKGYKVRAVQFSNVSGDKMKTEIENIKFPVKFSTRFSEDSAFSVDIPGPLFLTSQRFGHSEYLYNDMSNGSYYHIQRLNYMGHLQGHDQAYTQKRIDSLLYENIPGKILSKKEIKVSNGFTGFDIVNKTRRGDIQRYQIYIGPLEIFVFKMNGRNEYVNGKEGEQFFSSIRFASSGKSDLKTYQPKEGGFSVIQPGEMICNKNHSLRSGLQRNFISSVDADGNYYFLCHTQVFDFEFIEEDTFELNYLSELFAEDIKAKIVSRKNEIVDGRHELRAELEKEGKAIYLRLLIQGENYYLAGTTAADESKRSNYLQSLKTREYRYAIPFREYTDTSLFFRVNTTINPSAYATLVADMGEYNRFYRPSKEDLEERIYRPFSQSRVYNCFETGEKIQVEFRKFSMYYQMKNTEEFWDAQEEDLVYEHKMFLRKDKPGFLHSDTVRDYLLVDTNSTRGLRVRKIQKCGAIYTLTAQIDTVSGTSGFIGEFFSSFTPADTCIGVDVYSDKLKEHFFGKIYSKDTLERKRAYQGMGYVVGNLLDEQAPQLIQFIDHPEFSNFNIDEKRRIISGLGRLKSKDILPFYEKLYGKYTDSSGVQLSILRGISRQKTVKSVQAFLKMLDSDLPVSSRSSEISEIFYVYSDSLELGAQLFPSILKYTKYPEYREPIYKLMSKLALKGHLKKSHYAKYKKDILSDAQYDLKIYLSSTEEEENNYYYRNNTRSGSSNEISDMLSDEQQRIFSYTVLLMPFAGESEISKYLSKVMRTPKEDLKILVSACMKKNKLEVNDTIWMHYAKQPETRIITYRALSYFELEDLFPKEFSSQDAISFALLYGQQKELEKDTVVLVRKVYVPAPANGGNVYIYKSKTKDKSVWKLAYSGYQPADENKISIDQKVSRRGISFDGDELMEKEITAILKKLRTEGRKRAGGNRDYFDYGDYDYYD